MFLSNRDIKWAIDSELLIVAPRPEGTETGYDETSVDLHLDSVAEAKVWDADALRASEQARGSHEPAVHIGSFNWASFSRTYLTDPPDDPAAGNLVFRRGREVCVRPRGFLLWQTKEVVGTPKKNPAFISFVNAKSTKARTGLMVHLTAPTIHAGWSGKITLEIANLGPFTIVLQENDVIAQITVATVSSPPDLTLKTAQSATAGQAHVTGEPERPMGRGRSRRR